MSSLGIGEIRSVFPADSIDNEPQFERFGANPAKIGMKRLTRLEPEQTTADLAAAAARRLFDDGCVDASEIQCLIVVTQNPEGHGLPHTSARIHATLGLPESCACFDVGLGCSGFVYGVSLATAFMAQNGMTRGLLVTADPYSKIVDPEDRDTAMLFGDAAAATLLTDRPQYRALGYDFGTRGKDGDALHVRDDGRLTMNGRAVFAFSATEIPRSIDRVLSQCGWSRDDVDRYLVHQGSQYIVERIARALDAKDRTPFAAAEYGNTISSSLPLLLQHNVEDPDRRILLSGFGVGLSWASAAFERVGGEDR